MLSSKPFRILTRNFNKTISRMGHGGKEARGGVPGDNLPINLNWSNVKMTLVLTAFWGVGLGAPFIVVRHALCKK